MRTPLPIWSIPLMLVLVGVVLAVGRLPVAWSAVIAGEMLVAIAYMLWRGRGVREAPAPVSNVLSLLPGHLLLLLALALSSVPRELIGLWILIPAITLAYDWVSMRTHWGRRLRSSILIILYGILWADLLYLLERIIARSRRLTRGNEILVAVAFGVFGILFVSIGIYRHWRAGKE